MKTLLLLLLCEGVQQDHTPDRDPSRCTQHAPLLKEVPLAYFRTEGYSTFPSDHPPLNPHADFVNRFAVNAGPAKILEVIVTDRAPTSATIATWFSTSQSTMNSAEITWLTLAETGRFATRSPAGSSSTARTKVDRYRAGYAALKYAFLPCVISTSGRLHGEFLRLLYIITHRRTSPLVQVA